MENVQGTLKSTMLKSKIVTVVSLVAIYVLSAGVLALAYSQDPAMQSVPTPTVTVETPGPVKTKIVTTPGPTVTVTARASRSQVARRAPSATQRAASSTATLACIRKHESSNNYRAVSASGTYRGAYQMSVQYSDDWARRAGYESWAEKPADKWPPAVQDAVAADMGRSGWGHWSKHTSYNCPGF